MTRRAQEDDVVLGGEEVELAEVEDERLLNGALEAEVGLLEGLAGGEAGLLDPCLAAVRITGGDLGLKQRLGELLVAPLLLAGALSTSGMRSGSGRATVSSSASRSTGRQRRVRWKRTLAR
jgi:hypothetical protein